MRQKIGIILISIIAVFILMSGGYSLWLKTLTIKGNIQVRPLLIIEPVAEELPEEDGNGEEESPAGDNTPKTQNEDLNKLSEGESGEPVPMETTPEDEKGISGENKEVTAKDQANQLNAGQENSSSHGGQGDGEGAALEGVLPISEDNTDIVPSGATEDREGASPAEGGSSDALAVSQGDKASAEEQTGDIGNVGDHSESEGGIAGEGEMEAQERTER